MAYLFSLLQDFCAANGRFGRLAPSGNYTFFISHLRGEKWKESWKSDEIETLTQRVNNDPRYVTELGMRTVSLNTAHTVLQLHVASVRLKMMKVETSETYMNFTSQTGLKFFFFNEKWHLRGFVRHTAMQMLQLHNLRKNRNNTPYSTFGLFRYGSKVVSSSAKLVVTPDRRCFVSPSANSLLTCLLVFGLPIHIESVFFFFLHQSLMSLTKQTEFHFIICVSPLQDTHHPGNPRVFYASVFFLWCI